MDIFGFIGLVIWYAITGAVLLVVALMVARLVLNKADLNPFSRPVIMLRRWTDPLVNPVRRPLAQFNLSPNIAPLVVILLAILLGYFASQFASTVLFTAQKLVRSVALGRPGAFVGALIFGALAAYSLMIVLRVVLSYVVSPHSRLLHFLIRATEPVLRPARRLIPPLGMLDLSPLIVLLLLDILQRGIAARLP